MCFPRGREGDHFAGFLLGRGWYFIHYERRRRERWATKHSGGDFAVRVLTNLKEEFIIRENAGWGCTHNMATNLCFFVCQTVTMGDYRYFVGDYGIQYHFISLDPKVRYPLQFELMHVHRFFYEYHTVAILLYEHSYNVRDR